MAKAMNAPAIVPEEERGPTDLLEADFSDGGEDGKRYAVTAGGEEVRLTLEQLMELARRCLEQGAESGAGSGETGTPLDDLPELLEFVESYPDVTQFPPEVEEQIRRGQKPLEAYRGYENALLRKKLRALEQNESNKKSAIGSLRGESGGDDELDDLMAVYNSVFK